MANLCPLHGVSAAEEGGSNVYSRDCPARMIFERLADKWALLIIKLLKAGPLRFSQLKRAIEGVSQKALSQTLRRLERDGLVARTVFATVPVTVEYALTALGETVAVATEPLMLWAETHNDAVLESQRAYDARLSGVAAG